MIPIFSNTLGKEELEAVEKVFQSQWLGFGKETQLFEKEFGKKIGNRNTLMIDSCSAGIFMSMRLLGIGKNDQVIIPSIHFIACPNAVLSVGARPIFTDVALDTLNILPEEIERLRTKKTKAVFLLHYGGHPCDMDKLAPRLKNLVLIEDSANSPFSKYKGKNCGTFGEIGVFSFDAMKILVTGNGGAICFKDKKLYEKAIECRHLGLTTERGSGTDSLMHGNTRWWEIKVGSISNRSLPDDIMGAIGRVQLRKMDSFLERREEIWQFYQKGLAGIDWLITPPEPLPRSRSSYYLYWLRIKKNKRDDFARFLVKNNIYCTFRYFPLHKIKIYGSKQRLKNAERLAEEAINIPLHQNLTDNQVSHIVKTIRKFSKKI